MEDHSKNVEIRKNNILVGANQAQVDKVEEMIKEGRRYFGSSGASLTYQISDPAYKDKGIDAGLAKVGLAGEHKTTKFLRDWIKDKPNAVLIDSVHVKGYGKEEYDEETGVFEGGDTDHILVVGDWVIIIDSKNWKSRRRYEIDANGNVKRGKQLFPGGKLNSVRARALWRNYLREHRANVSSIVIITSDKVAVTRNVYWWKQGYRLITMEEAEGYFEKVWEAIPEENKNFIDVNLVASIASNAIKPYNVFEELLGETAELLDP